MDNQHLSRVSAEMNATTHSFLAELMTKLEELYHTELSSEYLDGMNEHLKTYYEDVLQELGEKKNMCLEKIHDLKQEAVELKRMLNVNIDFDLENSDDMPLDVYKCKLKSDVDKMVEKYKQKQGQIYECLEKQQILCEELDEELRNLQTDPLASDDDIDAFEDYLLDLQTEKARRINEIQLIQIDIQALTEEMGIETNELSEITPQLSKDNIRHLQNTRELYQKQKENVIQECKQMLQQLEVLWDCLEAPMSIRSRFRSIAAEHKVASVKELNRELKSCKSLKQENMKAFIEKLRIKLIEQWDKIYKSQEERESFEFLRSDTFTEDLLQLHEMELEECTRFYNDNKTIFDLFNSRNEWWEKKKALEAKQNEPNRYNNRGGQLLKEEKERKQTDIEIPKIEKRINSLVEEFQRQNNREFTINGLCIIELMKRDWDTYRDSKELLKSARKAVATPNRVAMTPRTPMHQVTMKRMASTTNLGLTTGNLAKKRHLDIPSREINRTASAQKMGTSSYLVKSHTKRNLFNQYNDETIAAFAKPLGKSMQQKRLIPSNKKGTLANISASKILKKYRLSSNRRQSSQKGIISDESLVNYDVFETNMKTSQISNSSVVSEFKNDRENIKMMGESKLKNNNYRTKSPLKPSNLGPMQINSIIDLV